jgi:hypothetical protein
MKRENILNKGNDSLAISAVWGVGALAHPCPLCVLSSAAFFINAAKEKLVD